MSSLQNFKLRSLGSRTFGHLFIRANRKATKTERQKEKGREKKRARKRDLGKGIH